MAESKLIYPGHPEFDFWLSVPPPYWPEPEKCGGKVCWVANEVGILRPASFEETTEYLEGGEYDERLQAIEDEENGEIWEFF